MADLFGGDSRKLLVSLKVADGDLGKIATIHGELVFRDPKGGELQRTAVMLGVDRTDNAQLAMDSVDKNVMAQVLELDAARSMRQAAQAYEQGDQAAAVRQLQESRRKIQDKAAHYKLDSAASAQALDDIQGMETSTSTYAPTSSEAKGVLKASKQRARVMSKSGKPSP
jgi:hypothetical protein